MATGAVGEQRAADRLERPLDGDGVRLLHDRRMPGSSANIDHIAVGSGGVTVIDTKIVKGKVALRGHVEKTTLWIAGRDRTSMLEGALR